MKYMCMCRASHAPQVCLQLIILEALVFQLYHACCAATLCHGCAVVTALMRMACRLLLVACAHHITVTVVNVSLVLPRTGPRAHRAHRAHLRGVPLAAPNDPSTVAKDPDRLFALMGLIPSALRRDDRLAGFSMDASWATLRSSTS